MNYFSTNILLHQTPSAEGARRGTSLTQHVDFTVIFLFNRGALGKGQEGPQGLGLNGQSGEVAALETVSVVGKLDTVCSWGFEPAAVGKSFWKRAWVQGAEDHQNLGGTEDSPGGHSWQSRCHPRVPHLPFLGQRGFWEAQDQHWARKV